MQLTTVITLFLMLCVAVCLSVCGKEVFGGGRAARHATRYPPSHDQKATHCLMDAPSGHTHLTNFPSLSCRHNISSKQRECGAATGRPSWSWVLTPRCPITPLAPARQPASPVQEEPNSSKGANRNNLGAGQLCKYVRNLFHICCCCC